jgi:hypothetical protein
MALPSTVRLYCKYSLDVFFYEDYISTFLSKILQILCAAAQDHSPYILYIPCMKVCF